MPNFTFTARTATGQTQKGTITAHSRSAAILSLRNRQLQPLVLKEVKPKGGMAMEIKLPGSGKIKPKDLVVFTRQFSTMVSAGVPILRALTILREQSESAAFRKVLEQVTADVQGGKNLSDAMAHHPQAFSPIYVNMVRAGETGGILDEVLGRLAYQQEKDAALRGKIRAAMVYPIVITVVTMIAFFVLMTFIVPKIGNILTQSGVELPIYTKILLALSNILKSPGFILATLVLVPIAIVVFRRWKKTPAGRYKWHSLLLRIPAIRSIIVKTAVARFSRIFASLMGAGVSIVEALETTAGAIGNAVIEKDLLDASKAIQAGSQLSAELGKSKNFPPIVAQMLLVGEETGQTDTVIIKVAEFYEEEVDTAVGAISSIIEPVMILVLGGMVGMIAVSVFGPITQISTSAAE